MTAVWRPESILRHWRLVDCASRRAQRADARHWLAPDWRQESALPPLALDCEPAAHGVPKRVWDWRAADKPQPSPPLAPLAVDCTATVASPAILAERSPGAESRLGLRDGGLEEDSPLVVDCPATVASPVMLAERFA